MSRSSESWNARSGCADPVPRARSYDIFAINLAAGMIGYVYNMQSHKGALTPNQDLGLKIATPVGTFIGQLLFGWLADVVGRKKMYGLELMVSASCLPLPRSTSL